MKYSIYFGLLALSTIKFLFAPFGGRQLLKSGTSIGANVREAQNAESKNDFIHKFKIAAKEVDETFYWIELCNQSANYPTNVELIEDLNSISTIINKIISSSKKPFSN
jgi:four helix bundle protein